MRHWSQRAIFFFAFLSFFGFLAAPAPARATEYRAGEVLVRFRADARGAADSDRLRREGLHLRRSMNQGRLVQLGLPEGLAVAEAVRRLSADPDVLFAEPNYILRSQAAPNDPYFSLQWGLNNTGQVVAGYVGTPGKDIDALSAWELNAEDRETLVAVVDTGCALNHPDLSERIWTNPNEIPDNGRDDDGNGFVDDVHGWDVVDNDNAPWDSGGHGTHVAGIIAAQNNNGLGISGVSSRTWILPVRFMDAFDSGSVADAIVAIEYALAQGARIINCSWGGSGYSTALYHTMAAADALFVCAAGNNATDNDDTGFYPAGFDLENVLAVAAVDQMGHLAGFSNYGFQSVDVAAPGVRIYSLGVDRKILWQENFDSQSLNSWTTGGSPDQWGVRPVPMDAAALALSFSAADTYASAADTWAGPPALELSHQGACALDFFLIGATEDPADRLFLEISTDGVQWLNLPVKIGTQIFPYGIAGVIPNWTRAEADLGAWDNMPQIFLRLHFRSDSEKSDTGYFIDHMRLTAAAADNTYQYMNGTSMAAAFVSGLGGLLQGLHPDWHAAEIKTLIIGSVDLDPDLADLLFSGGRVNAFNALTLYRQLSLSARIVSVGQVRLSWTDHVPLQGELSIERRRADENEFKHVASVSAGSLEFLDTVAGPQTTYCYRLLGSDGQGNTGYSNQVLATSAASAQAQPDTGGGGGGGCFIQLIQAPKRQYHHNAGAAVAAAESTAAAIVR